VSRLKDRPVLVIGGLGFLGVNLTTRLVDLGARVTVLTPSRARHTEQAASLESRHVRIVEGDIREQETATAAVEDQTVVFNLSGQSGAIRSMEDPWTDLDVNLRGTLALLEALREVSPGAALVFTGSRLQYGRPAAVPVAEDAPSAPLSLHGVHKHAVEEYARLYGRLFGLRSSAARVTNPYGPGQPRGRTDYGVINRLVHQALAGETLTVYGDGAQLRDYVHVDDVVSALLVLADAASPEGRAYNVASGAGTSLAAVAGMIVDVAGSGRVEHVAWPPLAARVETGDFVADVTRIRRELGWSPTIQLREGLERTVAHYRSHEL
jgi:UDP-glucose 4-epimerase